MRSMAFAPGITPQPGDLAARGGRLGAQALRAHGLVAVFGLEPARFRSARLPSDGGPGRHGQKQNGQEDRTHQSR